MKIASGRIAKIIKAICIALTIGLAVCYTTSCSMDVLDSILNTDPSNPNGNDNNGGEDAPLFPSDHTDNQTKNLTLNVNFDNVNTHTFKVINGDGDTDRVFYKWNNPSRPNGILTNKHGHVLRLDAKYDDYKYKNYNGSYATTDVVIDEPSVITFEFKSDIWHQNRLQFYIYEKDHKGNLTTHKWYTINHKGYGDGWKKVSVPLEVGRWTIGFVLPINYEYGNSPIQNVVYIDNITITPNRVEYVEIYPKGKQETYVGGNKIKFDAVPLRGDRSYIEKQNITYSVTGPGSIDSNGVFKPGNEAGNCTLTAYVNGKPYTKSNIYVHQREYLLDPVDIGHYTFRGNGNIYDLDTINAGKYNPIRTDGFIVLKGYANTPLVIKVKRNGSQYYTDYFIRQGSFKNRIWLRLGEGDYILEVLKAPTLKFCDTEDPNYIGDLANQTYSTTLLKRLYVTNTSSISEENAMVIMPSQVVQSDELIISNAAHNIVADLPANPSKGNVLRSVHDFVIHTLYYDLKSINNYGNRRKVQDAVHTLMYRMGVCEGYANLYAAICRNLGLKVKVVSGLAQTGNGGSERHAWNHVKYGDEWYMVDATWDDPVPNGATPNYNDRASSSECYKFFMVAKSFEGHPGNPNTEPRNAIISDDKSDTMSWTYGEGCY